jgi:murein DD-endopeptidase MepM/ murein hydrolase activator NlpD
MAPLLALLLVLSLDTAMAPPAQAGSDGVTAAIRARQLKAEATMRRADRQITRLQKQRKHHAKRLKVAKRRLELAIARRDAARDRGELVEHRLSGAEDVLGRTLRVHPDPTGAQVADKPALRKRVRRLEARMERQEKKVRQLGRKVERARSAKQARLKKVGTARIDARKAARERAEHKLATSITQMLALAKERAGTGFGTASVKGFRRPARGTITQGYGCTGYPTNPRRGSCAHFHDGIDIAAERGTRVRASAAGYIAYVGWNPWDEGSRSWIVIIGHAGGYETIYGHLRPQRKVGAGQRRVRAGQRVERGDVIGSIGTTGRTTGPHVHWELSRGFKTLDPLRARR